MSCRVQKAAVTGPVPALDDSACAHAGKPPLKSEVDLLSPWRYLSQEQVVAIRNASSPQDRSNLILEATRLESLLPLSEQGNDRRIEAVLELYTNLYAFSESIDASDAKIAALFGILTHVLHWSCLRPVPPPSLSECYEVFEKELLRLSIQRPPFSVGLFTCLDVEAIASYFLHSYFRYLPMYQYALMTFQELVITTRSTLADLPNAAPPPHPSVVSPVPFSSLVCPLDSAIAYASVEELGLTPSSSPSSQLPTLPLDSSSTQIASPNAPNTTSADSTLPTALSPPLPTSFRSRHSRHLRHPHAYIYELDTQEVVSYLCYRYPVDPSFFLAETAYASPADPTSNSLNNSSSPLTSSSTNASSPGPNTINNSHHLSTSGISTSSSSSTQPSLLPSSSSSSMAPFTSRYQTTSSAVTSSSFSPLTTSNISSPAFSSSLSSSLSATSTPSSSSLSSTSSGSSTPSLSASIPGSSHVPSLSPPQGSNSSADTSADPNTLDSTSSAGPQRNSLPLPRVPPTPSGFSYYPLDDNVQAAIHAQIIALREKYKQGSPTSSSLSIESSRVHTVPPPSTYLTLEPGRPKGSPSLGPASPSSHPLTSPSNLLGLSSAPFLSGPSLITGAPTTGTPNMYMGGSTSMSSFTPTQNKSAMQSAMALLALHSNTATPEVLRDRIQAVLPTQTRPVPGAFDVSPALLSSSRAWSMLPSLAIASATMSRENAVRVQERLAALSASDRVLVESMIQEALAPLRSFLDGAIAQQEAAFERLMAKLDPLPPPIAPPPSDGSSPGLIEGTTGNHSTSTGKSSQSGLSSSSSSSFSSSGINSGSSQGKGSGNMRHGSGSMKSGELSGRRASQSHTLGDPEGNTPLTKRTPHQTRVAHI